MEEDQGRHRVRVVGREGGWVQGKSTNVEVSKTGGPGPYTSSFPNVMRRDSKVPSFLDRGFSDPSP